MKLLYIADPMCSWCYGFSQTMEALLATPGDWYPLELALVMGGLRPGTTDTLTPSKRDDILGHWQHVAHATGLPFSSAPNTAMHDTGFIYDTEPASRAVVTVRSLWPQLTWRYFKAVQTAFYAEARNVTRPEVLADIAQQLGISRTDFAKGFAADITQQRTQQDFAQCRQWGINGFPAVLMAKGDELHLACTGYVTVEQIRTKVHAVLQT